MLVWCRSLGSLPDSLNCKLRTWLEAMNWDFPSGLVLTYLQFSSYEPELFPDFMDRMTIPWTVLLISVSGKVVLTGTKELSESYEAFENIYSILKGFLKKQPLTVSFNILQYKGLSMCLSWGGRVRAGSAQTSWDLDALEEALRAKGKTGNVRQRQKNVMCMEGLVLSLWRKLWKNLSDVMPWLIDSNNILFVSQKNNLFFQMLYLKACSKHHLFAF